MRKALVLGGLLLLAVGAASAQQSTSFTLEEHVFNAGGHPQAGTVPTSASFQITLDSIGDNAVATGLNSASFQLDSGFPTAYPPPGEVEGLELTDNVTLVWNIEKSIGSYNLYKDLLSSLSTLNYGTCTQEAIADETTTDVAVPTSGNGFFYLVTAENKLTEEGTKGACVDGTGNNQCEGGTGAAERLGLACP